MNRYNPHIHHRKSIRMKGYDYAQAGLYFITICCQDRICRFGHVENGEMVLNEYGNIANDEWLRTPILRPIVKLHEYVVCQIIYTASYNYWTSVGANCIRPILLRPIMFRPTLFRQITFRPILLRPIMFRTIINQTIMGMFVMGMFVMGMFVMGAFAKRPYGRHHKPLGQLCADINHR